jgi:hypothetical protein
VWGGRVDGVVKKGVYIASFHILVWKYNAEIVLSTKKGIRGKDGEGQDSQGTV